jgi:amino acid transporter
MAVYAAASYLAPYLPPASRLAGAHIIALLAIVGLGLVYFTGNALRERLESYFNIGKLAALGLFIVAGLIVGGVAWERLEPTAWAPPSTIIASGMLGFLAYDGFELIANASDDIRAPKRTLPIAFFGGVADAIVVYCLAFVVAIGHLSFAALDAAKSFAVSAAAESFLGPAGFAIMTAGAVLASASAINADYFGASKLPPMLSEHEELPSAFHRSIYGKSIISLITIGILALVAVNALDLDAILAATSGGFLLVYAAVAVRLAPETRNRRFIPAIAALLCLAALAIMVGEFLSTPGTIRSGLAVGGIVVLAWLIEASYRMAEKGRSKI